MLTWLTARRQNRARIASQAELLIALYGDTAYETARERRIQTLQQHRHAEHRFWCAVAKAIAGQTGRRVGIDTATRFLAAELPQQNTLTGDRSLNSGREFAAQIILPRPTAAARHLRLVPKE